MSGYSENPFPVSGYLETPFPVPVYPENPFPGPVYPENPFPVSGYPEKPFPVSGYLENPSSQCLVIQKTPSQCPVSHYLTESLTLSGNTGCPGLIDTRILTGWCSQDVPSPQSVFLPDDSHSAPQMGIPTVPQCERNGTTKLPPPLLQTAPSLLLSSL